MIYQVTFFHPGKPVLFYSKTKTLFSRNDLESDSMNSKRPLRTFFTLQTKYDYFRALSRADNDETQQNSQPA